jgi:transglutaminase-like putative cysteine protease
MFRPNAGYRLIHIVAYAFLLTIGLFIFPLSTAAQEVIHFPDLQLEAAVRRALDRPTGLLTTADMALLKTLEAGRQNIVDLSGLEYAVNLESLNLYQNSVEDLSPLGALTHLRVLNLGGNSIKDISALRGLTALEELDLSHNRLTNIDALQKMTRLRLLHLEGNDISTLTPLASLKSLEGLFLSGNLDDRSVSTLAGLTRLQRLMLADGRISNVTFLANMKQLRWLDLRNNQISGVEPLRGLTRLEWLSLAGNRVEELNALGGLRQLQLLDLNNNRVRQIAPLLRLRNLQWVELQNNFLELAEGTPAQRDLAKLIDGGVEVVTLPQKLPIYRGNGLVAAEAGSGGSLLRTPAEQYFTLLNYSAGWRIKSFTVVHEGGKPLDFVRELGYRSLPGGTFSWYAISGNNRVEDKKEDFYTFTFKQPGPVQLGLAIQLWPGYADDSARSFYISQVVLENVETEDLYTLKLERDSPRESSSAGSGTGTFYQDYLVKAAPTRAVLKQFLSEALQQRVSSLGVRYSGEALKMPDDLEAMLEEIFTGDDYLRYSQRSHRISWSNEPGGIQLLELRFQHLATREEEDAVERQVARILSKILTSGMDEHEKTQAVHDYIVANVAYDLNYREHSAYAALVKNRAVCQGYALLLYKMLNKAGVETRLISGKAGGENHLWNLVNLDGNWYHIDATWNDPVPDVPGRVRYDYYNRSDAQMAPTHSWDRDLYPAAPTPYPYLVN